MASPSASPAEAPPPSPSSMQLALPPAPSPADEDDSLNVKLSDNLLQSFAVGKVHRDHKAGGLVSMDFTYDGRHLVTSGGGHDIYVYSCEKAQRTRHLKCEKYGVGVIRFLHNDKDFAIAGGRSESEYFVKYWDFHENKYLRFFKQHVGEITSLSPHPYEDVFLSGADDASVLLWDLRQERPVAKIHGQGSAVASFDNQGLVFAACVGKPKVHLFDTRNYTKGEFAAFDMSVHLRGDPVAHYVQFSPCGKYVLMRTSSQLILVDAFDGELVCEYPVGPAAQWERTLQSRPPAPGFSPDSQYVMSGVAHGEVCIWSTTNARLVHKLEGHQQTPGHSIFSPTHALVVTAAESTAWWIPDTKLDYDPAPS